MNRFIILLAILLASSGAGAAGPECNGVPLTDEQYLQGLADKGDPRAEYALAMLWDKDRDGNTNVQRVGDLIFQTSAVPSEAEKLAKLVTEIKWLQKAVGHGYAAAQFSLGEVYYGLMRYESQVVGDHSEAITYTAPSYDKFYADTGLDVGAGRRNPAEHFPSAARAHDFMAQAIKLFQAAAAQGNENAHYMLAWCYASETVKCLDVKQDYAEAYFWLAALGKKAFGDPAAQREKFKQHLTPEQLAAVERVLQTWHEADRFPDGGLPPTNIAGLACGGESRGCKVTDSCGDVISFVCRSDRPAYHFGSKMSNAILGSCDCDCQAKLPKEWTCAWPKDTPKVCPAVIY